MKMWIIPVVVWVGLATGTLLAPKPENNGGFPLDPTKNWPTVLDPQNVEKKCNLASWVTKAADKQRCGLLRDNLTDIQNAYKGMSPLDLQNIKNNSAQISSSPAWKNLVWAKNNCPNFNAGLGTPGCPLTQKEFNTAVQSTATVHNQVVEEFAKCIERQNRVDDPVAAKRVLSSCTAQGFLAMEYLKNQWEQDTKPQDKK